MLVQRRSDRDITLIVSSLVLVAKVERSGATWVVGHMENAAADRLAAFELLADL